MKLKQRLVELLVQAVDRAQQNGELPAVSLPDITVEHPQNAEHGDYAASLPLKLARATRINPMSIAQSIVPLIPPTPEIARITVAPPGFINFTLNNEWIAGQVDSILAEGSNYGSSKTGKSTRIQLEFVSVNPTGPLHVGHGRGAILGSTLANVLGSAGYDVETEYYINDAGTQINIFKRSLYARYQQCLGISAEIPPDGYVGSYMVDLAQEIIAEKGDTFISLSPEEAVQQLGELGLKKMVEAIRTDLELLRVCFDCWFSERSLYQNSQYEQVMSLLRNSGYLAEKEGATWFVSSALGEDKDNVVIRSDGSPTYFATDIAYHYNKFVERKFDRVIDIWGADHQGHISRMKAVVGALGISPDRLKVIIGQMVTLHRGQELVRVSKRSGDIITLREVIEEVGADACRFFFLSRSADAQMDFDLELAKKESPDNPVYYIQYAHARIASIFRLARERGIKYADGDVSLLVSQPEQVLIRKMLLLPEILDVVVQTLEPHHLAYYALDLATAFHGFYKECRVVSDNAQMTKARLKLVEAAKVVLARVLNLMGMTAPETM